MNKTPHLSLAIAMALLTAVPLALSASDAAKPASDPAGAAASGVEADRAAKIERGRYLVNTSACHDCHTPFVMGPNGPEPDMSRALSGHPESLPMPPPPTLPEGPWIVLMGATNTAWAGPWGVSYTANLTPDEDTGLGLWSFENFRDTIRSGRHLGRGRQVLPPMPWPVYRNMTDQDLEAIYLYLQSIPPIRNKVPEPVPPPAPPAE
ncbi:c-type cytochrome [Arenimonas fontis]|uniref:Diheme cytochrome c-553 n=1 Tax=Arenimonas fontis TaxID=2608255 RepID=A0A5B2Z8N7_9GAMM|nr:c-type cytochrome [Arenimonas fontis]KAA2285068.1 diheme cytochrome c-553 [Arenimonas fontis]